MISFIFENYLKLIEVFGDVEIEKEFRKTKIDAKFDQNILEMNKIFKKIK